MEKSSEKYYIMHYPSFYGMGSNTDFSLVKESNLRRIIELEINKKNLGESYSERFTGTWNDEKFCADSNIDNVIDDVITKRLTTCSTYADVNDLVELPDSVAVIVSEESYENIIFRLCNFFGCVTDIIVGKAIFWRYKVDLTDFTGNLGIKNGIWYEFVEYDFKNAAETDFEKASHLVEVLKDRIKRLTEKRDGKKDITEDGQYIYDYIPEYYSYDVYSEEIRKSQALTERFSNLPNLPDEYENHLCKKDYDNYISETPLFFDDEQISENEKHHDYTKLVYTYPMLSDGHDFACDFERNGIWLNDYLSYEELFKKGSNVHYLMADFSNSAERKEDLGDINFFYVLMNAFVYE